MSFSFGPGGSIQDVDFNNLNASLCNMGIAEYCGNSSSSSGGNPPRTPQLIITPQGGITGYPDKLSTVLNSILSGLAIIKGRNQIPTTVSGEGNDGYDAATVAAILRQQQNTGGSGGNIAGQLQNLLTKNTGAVLIGGIVLVAWLAKSPKK